MKTKICDGKYYVSYAAGESCWLYDSAIDYMEVIVPDRDGDPVELYAEARTDPEEETATYEDLRLEIIKQAEEKNVNPDELMFFYDREDQEIDYIEI